MKVSLIVVFCVLIVTNSKLLDTSRELAFRQKRSLIWKEGINWVQLIVGLGLPIEVEDHSITVGTVIKAYYLLPTNSSDFISPSIDYARKKRSPTRWIIYDLIEKFFDRNGYGNGQACLLRSICEAASKPFEQKSGIFAEIVHAILTPSSTREDILKHSNNQYFAAESLGKGQSNCEILFSECPLAFFKKFTKILSIK